MSWCLMVQKCRQNVNIADDTVPKKMLPVKVKSAGIGVSNCQKTN